MARRGKSDALIAAGSYLTIILCLAIPSLFVVSHFPGIPNYGWEWGYYGQFNRVKHVIEDIPDVVIVDFWQHQDITLEDFGFELLAEGGHVVDVRFLERSPQMRERNRRKIRAFVEETLRTSIERATAVEAPESADVNALD